MGAMCCKGPLKSADDPKFSVKTLARPGEDGAGWLCKWGRKVSIDPRPKRRFFVLKGGTLEYFTDETRSERRGVINLFPRSTVHKRAKPDDEKRVAVLIEHPSTETRHLLAVGPHEAACWIGLVAAAIDRMQKAGAREAVLHKRGGVSHNEWQERFCVFDGDKFSSFHSATDNSPSSVFHGAVRVAPLAKKPPGAPGPCFEIAGRVIEGDGHADLTAELVKLRHRYKGAKEKPTKQVIASAKQFYSGYLGADAPGLRPGAHLPQSASFVISRY